MEENTVTITVLGLLVVALVWVSFVLDTTTRRLRRALGETGFFKTHELNGKKIRKPKPKKMECNIVEEDSEIFGYHRRRCEGCGIAEEIVDE